MHVKEAAWTAREYHTVIFASAFEWLGLTDAEL